MVAKLIPVKKDNLSEVVDKVDYSGWVINVADTLDRLHQRSLKFDAFRGLYPPPVPVLPEIAV